MSIQISLATIKMGLINQQIWMQMLCQTNCFIMILLMRNKGQMIINKSQRKTSKVLYQKVMYRFQEMAQALKMISMICSSAQKEAMLIIQIITSLAREQVKEHMLLSEQVCIRFQIRKQLVKYMKNSNYLSLIEGKVSKEKSKLWKDLIIRVLPNSMRLLTLISRYF